MTHALSSVALLVMLAVAAVGAVVLWERRGGRR